jgi:hypothetical protein
VETCEVEIWLMVDEDGDFEVSKDATDLQAPAGLASRMVRVTLTIPKPAAVELAGVVPAEATGGELKVA